jgi:hypothetical protein
MNHQDKYASFHLTGWILFLICAFLFLYVAVRDSDLILALASLVFLAGCVAFLIPLLFPAAAGKNVTMNERRGPRREKDKSS